MTPRTRRRFRRLARVLPAAGLVLGLAAAGEPVRAHAVVKPESIDAAMLVPNTPTTLTLRFNAAIHAAFAKVQLLDAQGRETPLPTRAGASPDQLLVELPAMPAGAYALRYRVLASDGHYTDNALRFRIGPGN